MIAAIHRECCTERIGTYSFRAWAQRFAERVARNVSERITSEQDWYNLMRGVARNVQERITSEQDVEITFHIPSIQERVWQSCASQLYLISVKNQTHRESTICSSLGHVSRKLPQEPEPSPIAAQTRNHRKTDDLVESGLCLVWGAPEAGIYSGSRGSQQIPKWKGFTERIGTYQERIGT